LIQTTNRASGWYFLDNKQESLKLLDKTECENHIQHSLRSCRNWRLNRAETFPGDKRNMRAANRLLELSSNVAIPDIVWSKIAPYFGKYDTRWQDAVSQTNREIEFLKKPSDFDGYLHNLVVNVTRH
jgi:hypothetical protein